MLMIGSKKGFFVFVSLTVLLSLGSVSITAALGQAESEPGGVLQRYLRAVYARDYRSAYAFLSATDRQYKTEEEYLRENVSFSGVTLQLARKLAELVELRKVQTERRGDRATLRFTAVLPDGNAASLQALFLEFDEDRLRRLSKEEVSRIEEKLEAMKTQGRVPMLEGEERAELQRERGRWTVRANWDQAIAVHFTAEVKAGLAWEFRPVQETVLAQPGETLQAFYTIKNLSDQPITAKARHRDEPKELAAKYLEIIQCFCFIQQTLAPGAEMKLPLTFRVHWDATQQVKEFRVNYEFYPIDKFPTH